MYSKKPIISVIIPTFNRAHLLEKSVQSVLQQTFTDFELIIVDDGSSDDTDEVVKNINDSRIKYIKCIENKGANTARNLGIKAAKSDFIAFQDSDDEWYPNKLEMHIEAFKTASSDVGVVYTGFYKITGDEKVYIPQDWVVHRNGYIVQELLKGNFIGTPSVLIRKNCLEEVGFFDEKLSRMQDWDLFIRLSKQFKFRYINQSSFNAYHTPISISTDQKARYIALEVIIKKYEKIFEDEKLLAGYYYSIGARNGANNNFRKARLYLIKSIKMDPFRLKYYLKFIFSLFGVK